MPLKFVLGPSGSGKTYQLYKNVIESASGGEFHCSCTGAVYDADAKRSRDDA